MRPLPSLPRFLCGADSEVAHQTIQFFLCVGLTTVFFSDPSSQAPYDWNYVYYMRQMPHDTPKTHGCCETCALIATGWHVGHMPSVAIYVRSHSVHTSHDRWYFGSNGFRDAVLLYYWSRPYGLFAAYVSTSNIPHFVRVNYKITTVADAPLGQRRLS